MSVTLFLVLLFYAFVMVILNIITDVIALLLIMYAIDRAARANAKRALMPAVTSRSGGVEA